jgi:hypothetical protein
VLRRDAEIWRNGRYWDDGWGGPVANVVDPVPDIALDEGLTHVLEGRAMRSWVGKWDTSYRSKGWDRHAVEVFLPGEHP